MYYPRSNRDCLVVATPEGSLTRVYFCGIQRMPSDTGAVTGRSFAAHAATPRLVARGRVRLGLIPDLTLASGNAGSTPLYKGRSPRHPNHSLRRSVVVSKCIVYRNYCKTTTHDRNASAMTEHDARDASPPLATWLHRDRGRGVARPGLS